MVPFFPLTKVSQFKCFYKRDTHVTQHTGAIVKKEVEVKISNKTEMETDDDFIVYCVNVF